MTVDPGGDRDILHLQPAEQSVAQYCDIQVTEQYNSCLA